MRSAVLIRVIRGGRGLAGRQTVWSFTARMGQGRGWLRWLVVLLAVCIALVLAIADQPADAGPVNLFEASRLLAPFPLTRVATSHSDTTDSPVQFRLLPALQGKRASSFS